MVEKKDLICINCPLGCRLTVIETEGGGWLVEGNECKRGQTYAIKELTNPTRVLTSTVKILNASLNRLPVRTTEAIPKQLIIEAMKVINTSIVQAPIKMGDIIISNLLDTGVPVIASRTMSKKQ